MNDPRYPPFAHHSPLWHGHFDRLDHIAVNASTTRIQTPPCASRHRPAHPHDGTSATVADITAARILVTAAYPGDGKSNIMLVFDVHPLRCRLSELIMTFALQNAIRAGGVTTLF